MFPRICVDGIRFAGVLDQRLAVNAQRAARRKDTRTDVAEGILILGDWNCGLDQHGIWSEQISTSTRVNVQHCHDRDGRR
jgi:hypothetical protein